MISKKVVHLHDMTPGNTRFLESMEPITSSISMVVVPVPSGYHRQSSRTRGDHDIHLLVLGSSLCKLYQSHTMDTCVQSTN